MERTLATVKTEMEAEITSMRKAQSDGDLKALNNAESKLKKLEKEYAGIAVNAEYDKLKDSESPFIDAIKQRTYPILRHVAETDDDGAIIGYKLVEKARQFDPLDLCRALGIDTDWQYDAECLNMQFTIRTAKELGLPKAEIDKIPVSYAMQKKAREIASKGGDITSNSKCKEALQNLIDAMPTPVDDNGNKTLKVNSYDVGYLNECYCKKGKSALAVGTAKKGFFMGLICDILYRLVTNGKYSVEYKAIKSK